MKIIHLKGYSEDELYNYRPTVFKNLVECAKSVIQAMEQFERNAQSQSSSDRNIEILSREFSGTGIDSALIAAIYVDSQDMGASREM